MANQLTRLTAAGIARRIRDGDLSPRDVVDAHLDRTFVSATAGTTAFLHGEEPETVDGVDVEPLRGWVLTQPYNFTGHPAASIPAGFADGLPVGMQIAGRRLADDEVVAASAAFERRRPWHDRYPE